MNLEYLKKTSFIRYSVKYALAWSGAMYSMILKLVGLRPPQKPPLPNPREILIAGGYGYGNTGDEAQLGANLDRWKTLVPRYSPVVLSPDPEYTSIQHNCHSISASRKVVFGSNRPDGTWNAPERIFRVLFWISLFRLEFSAILMRAGLPPMLSTSSETQFLSRLQTASVVHFSGGGYMTGPTRTRLWDACMIMRLCQKFGIPYFLSGQTLGLFEYQSDKWLAKTALVKALGISLRDPFDSKEELLKTGIPDKLLSSSFDDALFCNKADQSEVDSLLLRNGILSDRPFLAINYHWWGMEEKTRKASAQRLASILDELSIRHNWQILFIPMTPSDEQAQRAVIDEMSEQAIILKYNYEYQSVRGIISSAKALISFKHHPLIFAMGESTPCLSISFDPYYQRKNTGAMSNLSQEIFCIDEKTFFDSSLESIINDAINYREIHNTSLTEQLITAKDTQETFFLQMLESSGIKTVNLKQQQEAPLGIASL